MGALLVVARSRLRANLAATLLLIVLAGVGGGIVMASVAGVRRADHAWQRFQEENPLGDAGLLFFSPDGAGSASDAAYDLDDELPAVAALDGVAVASRATATVGVIDRGGEPPLPVAANVYIDGLPPEVVGRPVIVQGRMPDAARPRRDRHRRAHGGPPRGGGR